MKKIYFLPVFLLISFIGKAQDDMLTLHNLGHGTLLFEYNDLVIHIDPTTRQADYSKLPKADYVFVTHIHGDHYDLNALKAVKKEGTLLVTTKEVSDKGDYDGEITIMKNGDTKTFATFEVTAVPAYNHEKQFHPKGVGNGYVFSFRDKKVYVAGDTEDVPEMADISANIAFLPMNQPYTMTPEQVKHAASMIEPDIVYIYHYGNSDVSETQAMLAEQEKMEVRVGPSAYQYNLNSGESNKIE